MTDDRTEFTANRAAGKAPQQAWMPETREELRQRTRREVAEEIAGLLEERQAEVTQNRPGWLYLGEAITIARETGARP